MPRRKWIPKHTYERSAHADSLPDGLWWFRPGSRKSRKVVRRYLKQVARGRALDEPLKANLFKWLGELTQPVKVSPRRKRYWTLPAYALAHDLNRSTFLKRFREMDKIARRLDPERVPLGLVQEQKRISEKTKLKIKNEYRKLARADFAEHPRRDVHHRTVELLAKRYDLPPFRIGQICRGRHIGHDGKFRFPRL